MELRHVSQAFFSFFHGVYFLLTGNTKASDLKGDQSFLSFVNVRCKSYIFTKFLVSKETVVLRRWERSKQKFGFIKQVDKGEITTVKDLES